MNTFIGLSVAICAILAYSASGWLYPDAQVNFEELLKLVSDYFKVKYY
jgi:biopolymer transport protein ExbB/TolQ